MIFIKIDQFLLFEKNLNIFFQKLVYSQKSKIFANNPKAYLESAENSAII